MSDQFAQNKLICRMVVQASAENCDADFGRASY